MRRSCLLLGASAQGLGQPDFGAVPLGVCGGLDQDNPSAYLVAPAGSTAYVCLDVGGLRTGLNRNLGK